MTPHIHQLLAHTHWQNVGCEDFVCHSHILRFVSMCVCVKSFRKKKENKEFKTALMTSSTLLREAVNLQCYDPYISYLVLINA